MNLITDKRFFCDRPSSMVNVVMVVEDVCTVSPLRTRTVEVQFPTDPDRSKPGEEQPGICPSKSLDISQDKGQVPLRRGGLANEPVVGCCPFTHKQPQTT